MIEWLVTKNDKVNARSSVSIAIGINKGGVIYDSCNRKS